YVSLLEVRRTFSALLLATALLIVLVWSGDMLSVSFPAAHLLMPPRGVIVLDLLLGLLGLLGARAGVRMWFERLKRRKRREGRMVPVPTLLIGAGSAGAEALKQLYDHPQLGIDPVGFLDDDLAKHGLMIHGTSVLGAVADVARFAHQSGARQALITIGHPR